MKRVKSSVALPKQHDKRNNKMIFFRNTQNTLTNKSRKAPIFHIQVHFATTKTYLFARSELVQYFERPGYLSYSEATNFPMVYTASYF